MIGVLMIARIKEWLRDKLKRRKAALISRPHGDSHVRDFFTNAETSMRAFDTMLLARGSHKRLLILQGIGGVGKSTLLMMFRETCRDRKIPSAFSSGESASTPIDILYGFASDLHSEGFAFEHFQQLLTEFRTVQSKVATERRDFIDATTEVAKHAVGSIPVVGSMSEKLSDAAVDWLRSFLSAPQIGLVLNPTETLTAAFLADLKNSVLTQPFVLMIDTYERLEAVDSWVREFIQQLPRNGFMVLAGRGFPIENWSREWPGWVTQADVVEVPLMRDEDMKKLLASYFAAMGVHLPSAAEVEEIVRFARGLPLAITSAAGLWWRHRLTDFRSEKPRVVADLVDRLMKSVRIDLRPLLEAAASLRWFNKELLECVTHANVSAEDYSEIQRFEFIRGRVEGPAMHDVVRDIIDENVRLQDATRHRKLHSAAREFFELRTSQSRNEHDRDYLEYLYHSFKVDERGGLTLFQDACARSSARADIVRLAALVSEAKSWDLTSQSGALWVEYYAARVQQMEGALDAAERVYERVAVDVDAEAYVKAHALCQLGSIKTRWERLGRPNGPEQAMDILTRCVSLVPPDTQLADALFSLARVAEYQGKWDDAIGHIEKARSVFGANSDLLGTVRVFNALQAAFVLQGNWHGMRDAEAGALAVLSRVSRNSYMKARTIGYWAWGWAFAGRYADTERNLAEAIPVIEKVDTNSLSTYTRQLGLLVGMQGRYKEAEEHLEESIRITKKLGNEFQEIWSTSVKILGLLSMRRGDFEIAEKRLAKSAAIKKKIQDKLGIPEVLMWQGELFAATERVEDAIEAYNESLGWTNMGREYCEATALVGLARLQYRKGSLQLDSRELCRADAIALRREYNDHLAVVRFLEGRVLLDAHNVHSAIGKFKEAMIYALRFNRFALDDMVAKIVKDCRRRPEHRSEVTDELTRFWMRESNGVLANRPDTISLVGQSELLLQAEVAARSREPGDRLRQQSVLERLADK